MLKVKEKASTATVSIEHAIAVNIPREPSAPSPNIRGYSTSHLYLCLNQSQLKEMRVCSN